MITFRVKNIKPAVMSTIGFWEIIGMNTFVLSGLALSTHRCYLDRIRKDLALFEQKVQEINILLDSEEVRLDPEVAFDRHPFLQGKYMHPSLIPVYDWDPKRCRQKLRRGCEVRMREWRALAEEEMARGSMWGSMR